jgi:ABC-type polysaccharide transport system permease subunit
MIIIGIILTIDVKYLCNDKSENQNERIFRTSILCGFIIWVILIYFIYNIENEVPGIKTQGQIILDKF